MKYTYAQLKKISDSVGKLSGWDFSKLKSKRAPVPWDYSSVVKPYLATDKSVLDVGTGGGELFLALSHLYKYGFGIDQGSDMINQAIRNKKEKNILNVDFKVGKAGKLEFADESFDVVLNRHSRVDVAEICRVLHKDGFFITQQVTTQNALNLIEEFGWTSSSYGNNYEQRADLLAKEFKDHGCHIIAKAEYDVQYWFCDIESLVFWLQSVPLPEPFNFEKHWECVLSIIDRFTTEFGIETNESRDLLIIQKPGDRISQQKFQPDFPRR